jgi:sodium-dependent phosphate cotransporter
VLANLAFFDSNMSDEKVANMDETPAKPTTVQDADADKVKWGMKALETDEIPWKDKSGQQRVEFVLLMVSKMAAVLALLYIFIISLSMMGDAFKILGGKRAGRTFRNSEIFNNPFAGLVLGILTTVLVQSSSTSTSIIISMTAADLMTVRNAIPMIMGANIGTSVTNTIVSMAQIGDKEQYRRAFAGATVHDCFNLLTVSILLPVEAITGMLQAIAEAIASAIVGPDSEKGEKVNFLKKITKPLTSMIMSVDKGVMTDIAEASTEEELDELYAKSMIKQKAGTTPNLFVDTPLSDESAGVLLLFVSLMLLSTTLLMLVKTLQSVFRGNVAIWMQFLLNLEFKSVPFVGDYILLLFGVFITIMMQSSSITTSTLTPLVGIGLIGLDKMFPFTVGANIGTTVTGILSALASSNLETALTVSIAHVSFNFVGTLIWFPIPMMRRVPLNMARVLGALAADMKVFPIVYTFVVFGLLPMVLLAISLAGVAVFAVFGGLIILSCFALIAVIALRFRKPEKLPELLRRDPAWMPPSLCVVNKAEVPDSEGQESAGADAGKADLGAGGWWLGPIAYSSTLCALFLLMLVVPNGQWAGTHYEKFDGRYHVGLGGWSMCSGIFKEDGVWASPVPPCDASAACEAVAGGECTADDYSDTPGANSDYEDSWESCKSVCSVSEWETFCMNLPCGGVHHQTQCRNITKVVEPAYHVTFVESADPPWQAGTSGGEQGNRCLPVEDICDNHAEIKQSADCGVVALVFVSVAVVCLTAAGFAPKQFNLMLLGVSLGAIVLSWIMLLSSLVTFEDVLNSDATCIVQDISDTGAVMAHGKFKDITRVDISYKKAGALGFRFLCPAIAFLSVSMILVFHHVAGLLKPAENTTKSSE